MSESLATLDDIRALASLPSNGSVYFDHVPILLAHIDALAQREAQLVAALEAWEEARGMLEFALSPDSITEWRRKLGAAEKRLSAALAPSSGSKGEG